MTSIGKLGAMQQLMKGGKMMPANVISDDSILVKKIVSDHNPEGLDYDVKPLLHIVEDILRRSTLTSSEHASVGELSTVDHVEDRNNLPAYTNMLEALSVKIDRISCEISYKILSGVDAHSTTVSIFEMLTIYKWDVKLVLALAAFALNYGEFWLLAHIHDTNQLAKSMAILKQLPGIMQHSTSLKPRFDTLNDLVNVILEVTKCVIEFNELPVQYISQDVPAYSTASKHIPVAAYWCIRSIVACAAQITSLTTLGYEIFTSNDAWELSTLAFKLKSIVDHLKNELAICHKHIGDIMDAEAYRMLRELFSRPHNDNMKIIKALIYSHEDNLPLYDGVSKKRASLEALRRKNVLLLFSGLEFSTDELLILEQIYNESKAHTKRQDNRYELVWIPIVDQTSEWTDQKQIQFENLRDSMTWYSVYDPSSISKAVVWFIQSEWKYKNKPILVVLDAQGRVACPNAIHMMWIWGSAAFPFTSSKEENLWKDETWRLELLVDGIDSEILNWIKEGKYIFLYGGDDPEWVRRFVKEARKVAQATQTPLEMVYVGQSNKRDQVQRVFDMIMREKLYTHSWSEQSMIWFFWTRLQSMLFSKIQLKQVDDNDIVMQEIKKLLSYDKQGGWIVLAKGSRIVVNGHAATGLQALAEYDLMWKEQAANDGFETAYKDHYGKLHSVANPCCRFEFSHSMGRIPDRLTCPECRRNMHVLTTFQCCHDDNVEEDFFVSSVSPPTTI
ncbi:protein SIEVE ELEMENT OCCLUSION B-like [Vicia villosa]|uniref:protein SIEVE ELEMENT OCCLUSION B-like n=1 Tax=Vicia villosa TaxID=3911 RepID=UPI00273C7894|nr:protein SIEVE ELEMENT OCCLUSION B-like [Vicia villosa]XP_058760532.1 protein SIEVE ELEMENT OCCLUSION B-like [Vicia villosa]